MFISFLRFLLFLILLSSAGGENGTISRKKRIMERAENFEGVRVGDVNVHLVTEIRGRKVGIEQVDKTKHNVSMSDWIHLNLVLRYSEPWCNLPPPEKECLIACFLRVAIQPPFLEFAEKFILMSPTSFRKELLRVHNANQLIVKGS